MQGDGKEREIIYNLELIYLPQGKPDRKCETFSSNLLCICKSIWNTAWCAVNQSIFPLCLAPPCINPPLCTLWVSSAVWPYLEMLLLFKNIQTTFLHPFTSQEMGGQNQDTFSRNWSLPLFGNSNIKQANPAITALFCNEIATFAASSGSEGGSQDAWLEKVKRNKPYVGYSVHTHTGKQNKNPTLDSCNDSPAWLGPMLLTLSLGGGSCWTSFPTFACLSGDQHHLKGL